LRKGNGINWQDKEGAHLIPNRIGIGIGIGIGHFSK